MFAIVLHIFLGQEHFLKTWLISTLEKAIYFKGTIFFRGLQNLYPLHKIGWRSAEKNYLFYSNMLLLSYVAPIEIFVLPT
jgi:hypothetical protein